MEYFDWQSKLRGDIKCLAYYSSLAGSLLDVIIKV